MGHGKLVDYLLNPDHPKGGSKAEFPVGLGFNASHPSVLASALTDHFIPAPHARTVFDDIGSRRVVCEGPLRGVDGREPWIRSVWVVDLDPNARLLTIVPKPRTVGAPPP